MTDTQLFRDTVENRGLKYSFLAKELGITPYGLQKKIENRTEFKASEILILSDLLQLTADARERIFFTRKRDEKSRQDPLPN